MAKEPIAGRVKTRLAAQVGVAEATRFYRTALAATLGRLGHQPFWRTVLTVTPNASQRRWPWPKGLHIVGQGGGDIGARMQRPMRDLPPGPVCLIGSDIPEIDVADLRRAFRLLGNADAVFGPAVDGGFWLVGLRRRPHVVEPYGDGIRWSSPETLADVLRHLGGRRTAFTTRRADVDSISDLRRVSTVFGRRIR